MTSCLEVEKQLRSVKLQAGKARVYQEHTSRLDDLRMDFALHEYHVHFHQSAELNKQVEDAQFRVDDLAGDLENRQAELTTRREQFDALTQSKQRLEYELVQTAAAVQAAQQKQHYSEQQLKQIEEQLQSFDRDKTSLEQKLAEVTASLGPRQSGWRC